MPRSPAEIIDSFFKVPLGAHALKQLEDGGYIILSLEEFGRFLPQGSRHAQKYGCVCHAKDSKLGLCRLHPPETS